MKKSHSATIKVTAFVIAAVLISGQPSAVSAEIDAASQALSVSIPVNSTVNAGTSFIQTTAGNYFSVGLRADGSVWTWGRNLYGELGIPDTTAVSNMNAPVRLSALSDITSIASSGYGYQLGVKKDGSVWEWGIHSGLTRESQPPRQLSQISGASQVSTLQDFSFALMKDGTVSAWSRDHDTGESTKPFRIDGLNKITQLDISNGMVYALDSSGSVWIFSASLKDKQLLLSSPSRMNGLPALKQISVYHSSKAYGVDADGTAWVWSVTNSSAAIKISNKPSKIYPQLKAKSIKAANGYAVLLTQQGEVWTYGKKPAGKEGKVNGLSGIVSIAAGDTHGLAIDSQGQVWGWGANQWNEVGVPRNTPDGMIYIPQRIQKPITVIVNGKLLPASFPSVMTNNQISIPLKNVAKELGASLTVTTSSTGQTIYKLQYKQTAVTFQMGSAEAQMNGQKLILSSPVYGMTGATMIPASLLRPMGFDVSWDPKLAELYINVPNDSQ
ncbi:stalk domain-containing protein [Paenibacillus dendrobii]|nr:stalk domain-containing protein [Paenibacillus dendrobii]